MDIDTIVSSFEKTGRAAVIYDGPHTAGMTAEITAVIQEESLLLQEAPIERITGLDTHYPLYVSEDFCRPGVTQIEHGICSVMEF